MTLPSEFDEIHMKMSRAFIDNVRTRFLDNFVDDDALVLDVGNQKKYDLSKYRFKTVTLDLSEDDRPDIVGDITRSNSHILSDTFDVILCTEVLEHVVDPFAAVRELKRILKKDGYLLTTTPLNARIHGPIPDCWRFTEFGLKVLFRDWEVVELFKLDTPNRNLFPLHYGVILKNVNNSDVDSDPREMQFTPVA